MTIRQASLTQVGRNSAPSIDRAFYRRIADASTQRERVKTFTVPILSGRAWKVPAGHVFRITAPEGAQVGELNIWGANDAREHMWAARTRQMQTANVSTFDRIWSTLPFFRPIATVTADTLSEYGTDEHGARVHDLLGTYCDPYSNKMQTGEDFDNLCYSNLIRAISPFGLSEFDIHDALTVFQCAGVDEDGKYFKKPSPARKGDYLEFFAEIDLVCALSICQGGDLSSTMWTSGADGLFNVGHPLGVEIYQLEASLLEGWHQPATPEYRGQHGMGPRHMLTPDGSVDWTGPVPQIW